MIGSYHIKNTRARLYNIRTAAACICDRIVDSRLVAHMLSQKLYSNVHKLHCVQCTASHLRCTCRMRSSSGKLVLYLDTGIRRSCCHLIDILRMPGKCHIQLLPYTISCHKCFCGTTLFSRTAIEEHRTGNIVFLKIGFDSKGSGKGSCTKKVVSTSMTISTCTAFFSLGQTGLLGKSGKCIIFRQNSDIWTSMTIRCGKCRLNTCCSTLYFKTFRFQCITIGFC